MLAENETPSTYEELKPNDGQPLDIWRVEVVVSNNSGRVMDDLRVFFPFDSERPPCTNWEESPGLGFYFTGGVWIQFQKGRGGVQPGEDVREAKQLLVFHTDQPSFGGVPWRIHYEFAPGPAVEPPAADADSPRAGSAGVPLDDQAGVHGQAAAFDPAETCEGKAEGAECWHQLDSHPGCYVWNSGLKAESTASWTGACNGSVAEGEGVLTWAYPEGASVFEGVVVGGKQHGRGSYTSGDGTVAEGTYANGHRTGRWRITYANGTVAEGIFANGHRAGRWGWRQADGTVVERSFVNGEIHGTQVVRFESGTVEERPYVNGERHGTQVTREADGDVIETPYVNGEIHGTQVVRFESGTVEERPYVNGERHGTQVTREADGDVIETPYVNGKIHGTGVVRFEDGRVKETPYVNGEIHGTQVEHTFFGSVVETPYVNGERHGTRVERMESGSVLETPFVNGKKHGTEVFSWDSEGVVKETPYVNGEIHGTEVWRWADGRMQETPWVNGKGNGTRVERTANGDVLETPFVNGKIHGTRVWRDANGNVTMRRRYVNGTEVNGEIAAQAPAAAPAARGRCLIPGFPEPADPENLGLPWCPASVDFQIRVFALSAAGAQCAIATGSSSTPEQIEARNQETADLCGRLDAVAERFGGSDCRCPASWRGP